MRCVFFFFCATISLLCCHPSSAAKRWMAVGSADRLEALAPLAEHRRAGGYEVILTESSDAAQALRSQTMPPDYLLLLGNESLLQFL